MTWRKSCRPSTRLPLRGVSVLPRPNSGNNSVRSGRVGTPRQGGGEAEVDELQIVVGGWREAKREDIELEIQTMFERIRGSALLKRVYVPYVRCGFCRCELVYPEPDIWKQRKLQGVVVQALKDLQYASQIRGQEGCKLWAARKPISGRKGLRSGPSYPHVTCAYATWENT